MEVVVRDVKKLAVGLAWWKDRIGVDLKADLDTSPRVEASRKGCRTVKAILRLNMIDRGDMRLMKEESFFTRWQMTFELVPRKSSNRIIDY